MVLNLGFGRGLSPLETMQLEIGTYVVLKGKTYRSNRTNRTDRTNSTYRTD